MRVDSAGNIIIEQANAADIDITPRDSDGEPYEMGEGDKIVFTAAKLCCNEMHTIIRREFTAEDYDPEKQAVLLHLTSDDTDLPLGLYDYDCLYIFESGDPETFVKRAKIKITRAISRKDDENG